jgi:UDP-N-acetyl-D-glucosamine dehydrogenase
MKIGVVGLGYVGLPLAVLAGQIGYHTVGVDQDKRKTDRIRAGSSYIRDIEDQEIRKLVDKGLLDVSSCYGELSSCDVIIICVPTPLADDGKPDYSYLISAVKDISAILQPGQLVIVESTVAPGTTVEVTLPYLEESGLIAGVDFFLSYSPERVDPGNKSFRLYNTPKLVAGFTSACQSRAGRVYLSLGLSVVPVSHLAVAEMAKLLENTYRDINIAFINEMTQICRAYGINIWEVINAAATKPFGYQPFYPGPGVGGHCIPVDSVYYTYWAREGSTPAKLAEHARRVNLGMPHYVAEFIKETLQDAGKNISDSKILLLGVTYKKDIDDIRESPALHLIDLLQSKGAKVSFHDPAVETIQVKTGTMHKVVLEKQASRQDCVVLAVAHSAYNLDWLYANCPMIVDLTNRMANYPQDKVHKL